MNHNHYRQFAVRLALALTGAILLSACARSLPVEYYQLSAQREDPASAKYAISREVTIGLGPVRLPEYLDRPQIVSRGSANRLTLADQHRWAEPLADNLPRVLAEDLAALLGTDRILRHPWSRDRKVDCQISVELLEFEAGVDGTVGLTARWTAIDQDGQVLLPERRSSYTLTAAAQGQEALVAALSQGVSLLAREIAAALPPLLAEGASR